MKYIAITPISKFRRLSLLAYRPFEVKVKDILEILVMNDPCIQSMITPPTEEDEFYQKCLNYYIKTYLKPINLKLNSIITFYNTISAYEAIKYFLCGNTSKNVELFKEIITDQNPYLNQLRGRKFERLQEDLDLKEYLLSFILNLSFNKEPRLRMLLDICNLPIKDLTINLKNTDKHFEYVKKHLNTKYEKKDKESEFMENLINERKDYWLKIHS